LWYAEYERKREVSIKTAATTVVIFPKKVPGPLLPKTVWLDPPKAAPMLAPLPACKSTTRIRMTHTTICMIVTNICTLKYPLKKLIYKM
jgi:hypothetical protein